MHIRKMSKDVFEIYLLINATGNKNKIKYSKRRNQTLVIETEKILNENDFSPVSYL